VIFDSKISKNQVPIIERPTTVEREADRQEFDKLFGDLSDGNDSELDFVPKKKMKMNDTDELNGDDSDKESFEMDSSGGEEGDSDDVDDVEMDSEKD
jgi:hypothetical protein